MQTSSVGLDDVSLVCFFFSSGVLKEFFVVVFFLQGTSSVLPGFTTCFRFLGKGEDCFRFFLKMSKAFRGIQGKCLGGF